MEWTESLDFTRHFECAFYTVAKLPVDDAEKFCEWCLSDFSWKDEHTPEGCTGETVMMTPAAGFYTTPGSGVDQVRQAYVLCKGLCLCWKKLWKCMKKGNLFL